jgi:hypothetical protein
MDLKIRRVRPAAAAYFGVGRDHQLLYRECDASFCSEGLRAGPVRELTRLGQFQVTAFPQLCSFSASARAFNVFDSVRAAGARLYRPGLPQKRREL